MTPDDIPARARSLAGCPFCQATAQVNDLESIGSLSRWHQVECTECGATGPKIEGCYLNYFGRDTIDIYRQDAIAAWNTRAALSAPTAGGEGWIFADKLMNWLNSLDTSEMSTKDVRSAVYRWALDYRPPSPSSSGSGEGVEQSIDQVKAMVGILSRKDETAEMGYALGDHLAVILAALKSPAVEWQPRIGDPVQVSESCPYSGDWKRTRLWVAGLSIKRGSNGINISVCESWPPSSDGYTDGFYIGRPKKHDDLIPGHPLTQGSGS